MLVQVPNNNNNNNNNNYYYYYYYYYNWAKAGLMNVDQKTRKLLSKHGVLQSYGRGMRADQRGGLCKAGGTLPCRLSQSE